ncbi:MAG: hypothetical protein V8R40_13750 [Dysosmobacter sp.]
MPGRAPVECGNYRNLDLEAGKAVCRCYRDLIRAGRGTLAY